MNTAFKKTLLSTLVVPFALGAQFASADMITEWGYDVESVFSNAAETPGEVPTLNQPDDRTLEWGLSDKKSSISITNVGSPDGLMTNGASVMGGTFTHNNFTQPTRGAALESFDLSSTLTLNQVAPPGDAVRDRNRTFKSSFEETLDAGTCFNASSTPKCDDIFTIGNIDALNFELVDGVYKFVSDSFVVDDYSYTVFTELEGLGGLDNDACGLAGVQTDVLVSSLQRNSLAASIPGSVLRLKKWKYQSQAPWRCSAWASPGLDWEAGEKQQRHNV